MAAATVNALDLTFADPLPGGPLDGVGGLLERPSGGLDRGQPPQGVGGVFDRQVQVRVGGVQVGMAVLAVGDPFDADLAEDRGQ